MMSKGSRVATHRQAAFGRTATVTRTAPCSIYSRGRLVRHMIKIRGARNGFYQYQLTQPKRDIKEKLTFFQKLFPTTTYTRCRQMLTNKIFFLKKTPCIILNLERSTQYPLLYRRYNEKKKTYFLQSCRIKITLSRSARENAKKNFFLLENFSYLY